MDTVKRIDELEKELAELRLDNEYLRSLVEERYKDTARLMTMNLSPDEAKMTIQHKFVEPMALMMVDWFKLSGGVNYVALGMTDGVEKYEFTMQRVDGKTPSEIVADLKGEVMMWESMNSELTELVASLQKQLMEKG